MMKTKRGCSVMKSYVISASLGTGCYRHIRIGEQETLDRLHGVILNAFDFDDDHAHAFFMDDRYWSGVRAYYADCVDEAEKYSSDVTLRQLQLEKEDKFKFLFDFGDQWRFQCKVLRELEENTDIPGVVRAVGEAPEQYPDWEDEYEEDDEEMESEEEGTPLTEEEREYLYANLPIKRETVDEIRKYLNAAASLYGLLSIEELLEIYNSQNTPMDEQTFMLALMAIDMDAQAGDNFLIVDIPGVSFDKSHPAKCCQVATVMLLDDLEQGIRKLSRQQKGKPLKVFPKEEFLRFADGTYFPDTPQKAAMLRYMRAAADFPQRDVKDCCVDMQQRIVEDYPLKSILEYFDETEIADGEKWDVVEFARLLQDLNNNTHKHSNRGYTPMEMQEILAKEKNKPVDGQANLFEV